MVTSLSTFLQNYRAVKEIIFKLEQKISFLRFFNVQLPAYGFEHVYLPVHRQKSKQ